MLFKKYTSLLFLCCSVLLVKAQYIDFARPIIDSLCSARYAGRGYVNNGVNKAADFLARQFEDIGLKKFDNDYFQNYQLAINTFPSEIVCKLDGISFNAGQDFLIAPDCPSVKGNFNLYSFDITNATDIALLFKRLEMGIQENDAYVFRKADNRTQISSLLDSIGDLGYKIPLVIQSTEKKLLWWTSQKQAGTPKLIFPDSIISQFNNIQIEFNSKLIPEFESKNIIGFVPGKRKSEKYLVFTAHYDHLGMLGNKAYFPGASDNASGTAMLLSLAQYYATHKQDFPVIFILFSGEEVGLKGSAYFVDHPKFNLEKIKMLINIDIMGSATDGITVVNGEKEKDAFDLLTKINKVNKFLPEVKIRGKAANSDHYFFSEMNIPAVFIYSMGGPGYYHDVWDKPETLNYDNFDDVAKLLINFTKEY